MCEYGKSFSTNDILFNASSNVSSIKKLLACNRVGKCLKISNTYPAIYLQKVTAKKIYLYGKFVLHLQMI